MAGNQSYRLRREILEADENVLLVCRTTPGYRPSTPACSLEVMSEKLAALRAALEVEVQAQNALAAARSAVRATGWDFHQAIERAKANLRALYGPDSDQIAAVGLKKKSEYKRPVRRGKKTAEISV